MNNNTFTNDIKNPCPLNKLPMNKEVFIQLTKDCEWVDELLSELHENTSGLPKAEMNKRSILNIELKLTKKYHSKLGEYLLVGCQLELEFFTNCVKTLGIMKDRLELGFKACFINEEFENDEMYSDQIEIYMDNDMWDLHFYNKRDVDLKEAIHEQIYLNKNAYPTREVAQETTHDASDQIQ